MYQSLVIQLVLPVLGKVLCNEVSSCIIYWYIPFGTGKGKRIAFSSFSLRYCGKPKPMSKSPQGKGMGGGGGGGGEYWREREVTGEWNQEGGGGLTWCFIGARGRPQGKGIRRGVTGGKVATGERNQEGGFWREREARVERNQVEGYQTEREATEERNRGGGGTPRTRGRGGKVTK